MKIDVTIATKNNEETIERCIENIKKYIPYNRIILIDDSVDSTPKIAEKLGAEVVHYKAKLGLKRVKQAEVSNTEWIASIDSDVFIYPNWWKTMNRYISNNVGMIGSYLEGAFKNKLPSYDLYTKWEAEQRFLRTKTTATMGNNLLRRDLLLSCKKKLKHIHAGEDTIIGKHIVAIGYKCVVNKELIGFHFHKDAIKHHHMAYYRAGKSIVINRGKLTGLRSVFTSFITLSMKWTGYSFYSKKFDLGLYRFLLSLYFDMVRGIVSGIKEL